MIFTGKSIKIVARLGEFHCLMSFIGSIGTLMQGSGIENLLEAIYGKNTVIHISSGKAISRAIRAHFLVDTALYAKILEALDPNTTVSVADELGVSRISHQDKKEIEALYDKVMSGEECQEAVNESESLAHVVV